MRKSNAIKLFVVLAPLLLGFQNCSESKFDFQESPATGIVDQQSTDVTPTPTLPPDTEPTPTPNPTPTPTPVLPTPTPSPTPGTNYREPFTVSPRTSYPKVDILFVVDESASMSVIIERVFDSFETLSKSVWATEARMAVTNMYPADVPSIGPVDYTLPYREKATLTRSGTHYSPGFMRLVTASTIADYKAGFPSNPNFPQAGCNKEWMLPGDQDGGGKSCLRAAVQINQSAIGTEAGAISLKQMIEKSTANSKKLFQDGALVNVVFISDTHEPGSDYFGHPGAAARTPTYAEIKAAAMANNSTIQDVKISGFVPVPPTGDPLLTGLRVLGPVPATLADSKISSEEVNGFSYIPLIKASGGIATHAGQPSFSGMIKEFVDDLGVPQDVIVVLAHTATKINSVVLNGVTLSPADYSLGADHKSVVIKKSVTVPPSSSLMVDYDGEP